MRTTVEAVSLYRGFTCTQDCGRWPRSLDQYCAASHNTSFYLYPTEGLKHRCGVDGGSLTSYVPRDFRTFERGGRLIDWLYKVYCPSSMVSDMWDAHIVDMSVTPRLRLRLEVSSDAQFTDTTSLSIVCQMLSWRTKNPFYSINI